MTLIHISRMQDTPTDKEEEQLAGLDKYQMRYLKQWECGWCGKPCDRPGCYILSYCGKPCEQEGRIERRKQCLAQYKPRPNRRKKK